MAESNADKAMMRRIVAKFEGDSLARDEVEAWLEEKLEEVKGQADIYDIVRDAVDDAASDIARDVSREVGRVLKQKAQKAKA